MLVMKLASIEKNGVSRFCNARYLHTRMNQQNKAFYCLRALDGRGHFRLFLPPFYEELGIKMKEYVLILKLNYSYVFFTYMYIVILVYGKIYNT